MIPICQMMMENCADLHRIDPGGSESVSGPTYTSPFQTAFCSIFFHKQIYISKLHIIFKKIYQNVSGPTYTSPFPTAFCSILFIKKM